MIWLTGIGGNRFVLNAEHIETVESLPDITITLTNGRKFIVKESADEVIKLVIEYKRKIFGLAEIIRELRQGR